MMSLFKLWVTQNDSHQPNRWRAKLSVRFTVAQCKLTLREPSRLLWPLRILLVGLWWGQNQPPFTRCASYSVLSMATGKTIAHDWFSLLPPIINPMWTACLSTSSKSPCVLLSSWLKHQPSPVLHYCGQEKLKWNKLAPVCSNSACFLRVYITFECIELTVL